jgi:hypothetical protein
VNRCALSPATQRHVDRLFEPAQRAEAVRLLVEECGNNLPMLESLDAVQLERYRFAALKLGGGSLDGLRQAIALAKTDWRDLLMNAGFVFDVQTHERWDGRADHE